MIAECPECGRNLRERGSNFLRNIRRRDVDDVHDKYVCPECELTFAREEIVNEERTNITMKKWMDQ